jgi:peptide/nickel transport system permease protein
MMSFIAMRLARTVLLVLGVLVVTFFMVRLIPGDPARFIAPYASDEDLAAIREELGYDKPVLTQLYVFFGDAARGDFGRSMNYKAPVSDLVIEALPRTIILALCSLTLALATAVPLGILAAFYRDTVWDRLSMVIAVSLQSMPSFWVALMLILLVAVRCGVLPASGLDSW